MRGIMFQGKDDICHFAAFSESKVKKRGFQPGAYTPALAYISYRILYDIFYQYKCDVVFIFLIIYQSKPIKYCKFVSLFHLTEKQLIGRPFFLHSSLDGTIIIMF